MGVGPFTVDELVQRGLHPTEACMVVWPVTEEAFADWLRARRTLTEEQVVEIERQRTASRGLYQPHGMVVHHTYGESGQA